MQISCIQKHLGVFRRLIPSLLYITLSMYPFSCTNPPPLFFSFQGQFFASFPFSAFSLLYLILSSPSIYILPSPLVHFSDTHTPFSGLLLCLPSCPLLHLCLSQSIWLDASFIPSYLVYSKDNEEICEVSQCGSVVRGRI